MVNLDESHDLDESQRDPIVALARRAVEAYVRRGEVIDEKLPPDHELPGGAGAFVSLHLPDGVLRGCIGTFLPTRPTLSEEIVSNAISAATRDPRFQPVLANELEDLHVSVDILDPPEPVRDLAELDVKRYGIIVRSDDGRQALLLPDLEGVDTVEQQLLITFRKGGIDPQTDSFRIFRFKVVRHT